MVPSQARADALHTSESVTKIAGPGAPRSRKLGEVVASKVEAKIMKAGWPVGQVIGSESDLLAEYQVSRAVMREAIRLLEHHGTATMRRGPGGGLVVTKPDTRR